MQRALVFVAALAAVVGVVAIANADPSAPVAQHCDIDIDTAGQVTGTCVTPTTTSPSSLPSTTTTSVGPTSSVSASTSTSTTTPASTSTSTTSTSTTVAATTSTASPTGGPDFSEDFSDPGDFNRFDHDVSGDLHAGCPNDCRDGWPADHDMTCGNPNMTHRNVTFGAGSHGEDSPASATDPGFYACLPAGDPTQGHLMTTLNTAGYVISWFSPKPFFTDVHKVCFDNNLNWQSNGQWFQLVFLTQAEATAKPNVDGTIVNTMDLGYTSPDYPHGGGPSTFQGTAGAGVKFQVNDPGNGQPQFVVKPWMDSQWPAEGLVAGPGTTNKAPRYQICTTDNENGTLTITNGSPDGTVHTTIMAGSIPNGVIRVVFEHDEYNPDKHNGGSNADPDTGIAPNTGNGYTYHWDNPQIYTN